MTTRVRVLALVVALAALVAFASAAALAPVAAPAVAAPAAAAPAAAVPAAAAAPAKAPALIRMWTGAKPCAQTQQYFGSYLNGLAGRTLNVDYGYGGMAKFSAALKPYASGVRIQGGGAKVKSLAVAANVLRTYAKNNAAVVTGLFGQCATNLGNMGENNAQASVTQLPKAAAAAGGGYLAGGIKPGAIAAHACPELCAFAVALTTPNGGQPLGSCSVAVARGTGKANPVMRIAVSGGAVAQPALLVSPANVNIPYPGAAAPKAGAVAWVNAPVAAGAPNYDSCTINPAGFCAPAGYAGAADANSGYSPALEAVWQAQVAAGGHYPNPDPYGAAAPGHRASTIANQGGCSEDKLVADFIGAAATVE